MILRLPLQLHPESRCDTLGGLEVEIARLAPKRLFLRFLPQGRFDDIQIPSREGPARRRDELWRHTCFEAFLRPSDGDAYYEFNLSVSGDWAAYRFSGYRKGRKSPFEIAPPGPDPFPRDDGAAPAFAAALELERLADLPGDEPWRLGLSAIIEEKNGRLSYWALAHPPGAPDFHHPDCFTLDLPPPLSP